MDAMMTQTPVYTRLKNRGAVSVRGPDRRAFLQGLVSNDINLLDTQACVYACLLSAQGKFLHDFFMTEKDGTIRLDCEGGARAQDLLRRLAMYKLRADVELECDEDVGVWAILNASSAANTVPDPRHAALGLRSYRPPENIDEAPFEIWDRLRISLAVPDGSRDMIVGQSTLAEGNIDLLNGVSWDKGCYVGQELTARMHYRALVKKRLRPVKLPPPEGVDDLRSHCGDTGLAVVKTGNAEE